MERIRLLTECAWNWREISSFWRFQIVGWCVFFLLTLPIKLILSSTWTMAIGSFLLRDGLSIVLTLGMRVIYDAVYRRKATAGGIAAAIAATSLVAGLIQLGLFSLTGSRFPFEETTLFDRDAEWGILYYRTGLFVCWSLLYFGIRQFHDSAQRDLRLALIESEKRQAQLQMLRAQMNPHFLFNALNAIQSEVGRFSTSLKLGIKALAGYLRFSLDHTSDEFIPLGAEYDAVLDYFKVEKLRFGEEFELESHIDESARQLQVPGIILQPLVENAVRYGRKTSDNALRVRVEITRASLDHVNISVANTGTWLEPVGEERGHIGLGNIRRRLELLYPGKHRLLVSFSDGWVTVEIFLPALNPLKHEENHLPPCAYCR